MRSRRNGAFLPLIAFAAVALVVACSPRGGESQRDRASATTVEPTGEAQTGNVFDPDDRLEITNNPQRGAEQASVIIVEWSSFQCPFCGRVQPTLNRLLEEFPNDVRLVFKQHPLEPMQAQSRPAAIASLAADRQGKFFEYKAVLMENQRNLSNAELEQYAERVGLDMDQFRRDIQDPALNAQVDADLAVAGRFGIRGTPNFLINGRNLAGAQPYERFEEIVRAEIAAVRELQEGGQSLSQALGARLEANLNAPAAEPERPAQPDPNARVRVPVGESAYKGGSEALVTIVEFSSYQCPFCNRVRPTLDQIQAEYGDDVRIVFKHRPLDFQANSGPAARAAIAAQNQGKFWEFHAGLFENQRDLTAATFERIAESVGLNMERFRADLNSPETNARLQADQSLADQLQATGTPHFFINGMRLVGAQPFEAFKAAIDRELAHARSVIEAGASRAQVYDRIMADAAERPPMVGGGAGAQARPQQPQRPSGPVEIPVGDSPYRGPSDARVTVIEFSDFQCGFCGRLSNTLAEVMPEFDDRVRFVSKQFPLGRWPISQTASEAALAAAAQGKYWEFKALIYENQRGLTEEQLHGFAEQLGLNMEQFRSALSEGRYREQVTQEVAQGRSAGVSGTPALFINGRQVGGAIPAERLREELNNALGN